MNRIQKFLAYSMLTILALAVTFHLIHICFTNGYSWYTADYEKVCFGLWGLVFAGCFYELSRGISSLWGKIVASVVMALFYTVMIFLLNNYWRYICVNSLFSWEYPLSLGELMKRDLVFSIGWGAFRYPLLFLGMLLLCGLIILCSRRKGRSWGRHLKERLEQKI